MTFFRDVVGLALLRPGCVTVTCFGRTTGCCSVVTDPVDHFFEAAEGTVFEVPAVGDFVGSPDSVGFVTVILGVLEEVTVDAVSSLESSDPSS